MIWFNVSIYEMSFINHTTGSNGQDFLNSLPKKHLRKPSLRWCPGHVEGGTVPFSSANETTPVLRPGPGFCKPHLSHRSVVHCYPCYCSHFQEKRRNWLNPTARSQKISADCHCHLTMDERRVQTHPLNTDYRLIPQKTHRCPKKLESQAGAVFVVPVKSHNGLISLALASENSLAVYYGLMPIQWKGRGWK